MSSLTVKWLDLKASFGFFSSILSLFLLCFTLSESALSEPSKIKSDEEVIIFPSLLIPDHSDIGRLSISVHGWIFEPEYESLRRKALLGSFCKALKLLDEECEVEIFRQRARYFLVDNERNKRISFEMEEHRGVSEPSGKEGHFRAQLEVVDAEFLKRVESISYNPKIKIKSDQREFLGELIHVSGKSTAVVSDIDDTMKLSMVTDKNELLRNTFLREYKEAPGMVSLYKRLQEKQCSFHYISASPWQLYPSLNEFFISAGYPKGTFYLKEFRWKDSRFFDLFQAPHLYKIPAISSLIKTLPNHSFALIGDSGEKDPEIYGQIARDFSKKDIRILIRELQSQPLDSDRIADAFRGISRDKWRIINENDLGESKDLTASLTDFLINSK